MEKDKKDIKKSGNDFARFSGMAFEMLVIIGGMTWGAVWLDEQTGTETPWFTVVLAPLSVIIAVLLIIKDLNRNK
ncbi:hypothetical protein SDC9_65131 [bioreactor metagenome]|uniref:F0F1-ATPase subunit n=1 Tax=bioreactor metagenome TaxID=1076179 RepID=A0A644XSK4_9ZZZZ